MAPTAHEKALNQSALDLIESLGGDAVVKDSDSTLFKALLIEGGEYALLGHYLPNAVGIITHARFLFNTVYGKFIFVQLTEDEPEWVDFTSKRTGGMNTVFQELKEVCNQIIRLFTACSSQDDVEGLQTESYQLLVNWVQTSNDHLLSIKEELVHTLMTQRGIAAWTNGLNARS